MEHNIIIILRKSSVRIMAPPRGKIIFDLFPKLKTAIFIIFCKGTNTMKDKKVRLSANLIGENWKIHCLRSEKTDFTLFR